MNNYFAFLHPLSEQDTGLRNQRKAPEPREVAHSGVRDILETPQAGGNLAVQQLFRSGTVQAKLSISQPGDVCEEEADRVADQVMRVPEPNLHRSCAECETGRMPCPKCEGEKKGMIQPKTEQVSDTTGSSTPDTFLHNLGHGQPLDTNTRIFMEPRFGRDFSHVRVHTGAEAAESAKVVKALAYTVGPDVVFGVGQYSPDTVNGKRLLAHELAHIVQQRSAGLSRSGRTELGGVDSRAEAGTAAAGVIAKAGWGSRASKFSPPNVLMRQPAGKSQVATPPPRSWFAGTDISAGVLGLNACWSMINPEGRYTTQGGNNGPYSAACTGSMCAKEPLPLRFLFHVDGDTNPRPRPFENSGVAIVITFLPQGGGRQPVLNASSDATYAGPGTPLQTSFGIRVPFTPPEPGMLLVKMTHYDPSSGEIAIYSDAIPIVDCPKLKPQLPGSVPTGINVVIPDSKNTPLVHHRLTKQDGLNQPGIIVEVERDYVGYFYRIEGQKYYIPERP